MAIKVINTAGINGPATDFSSLYPSILVDPYGMSVDTFGLPSYNNITCNTVVTVPANQNMLWVDQLIVCGTLSIQGRLVQIA